MTLPAKLDLTAILIQCLCLMVASVALAQNQVDENRVKAAYLFHFVQFTEWAPEDLKNAEMSFCTFGEDPFRGELERVVAGKAIGPRNIRVSHVKQVQEVRNCQVLYVPKSETKRVTALLAEIAGHAVLTVGESDNFIEQGGMVRLFIEQNKLRFDINQQAAEQSGLRLSSRLLVLAKHVTGYQASRESP